MQRHEYIFTFALLLRSSDEHGHDITGRSATLRSLRDVAIATLKDKKFKRKLGQQLYANLFSVILAISINERICEAFAKLLQIYT